MSNIDDVRKLQRLEEEANNLKSKIKAVQDRCHHVWEREVYDPTSQLQGYGHKVIKQGSDIWGEPEGYEKVEVPRWRRTCALCGLNQYTTKRKIKQVDDGADFD